MASKRFPIELDETQYAFVSSYAEANNLSKSKACATLIQEGIIRVSSDLFADSINSGVRKTMETVALVEQRMREDMMHDLADEIVDSLDAVRVSLTALMLFNGGEENPDKMERCYEKALEVVFGTKG